MLEQETRREVMKVSTKQAQASKEPITTVKEFKEIQHRKLTGARERLKAHDENNKRVQE